MRACIPKKELYFRSEKAQSELWKWPKGYSKESQFYRLVNKVWKKSRDVFFFSKKDPSRLAGVPVRPRRRGLYLWRLVHCPGIKPGPQTRDYTILTFQGKITRTTINIRVITWSWCFGMLDRFGSGIKNLVSLTVSFPFIKVSVLHRYVDVLV